MEIKVKKLFLIICSLMPSYLICAPNICVNNGALTWSKNPTTGVTPALNPWDSSSSTHIPGLNPLALCQEAAGTSRKCCGSGTYGNFDALAPTNNHEYNALVSIWQIAMGQYTGTEPSAVLAKCVDKGTGSSKCIGAAFPSIFDGGQYGCGYGCKGAIYVFNNNVTNKNSWNNNWCHVTDDYQVSLMPSVGNNSKLNSWPANSNGSFFNYGPITIGSQDKSNLWWNDYRPPNNIVQNCEIVYCALKTKPAPPAPYELYLQPALLIPSDGINSPCYASITSAQTAVTSYNNKLNLCGLGSC